MIRFFVSFIMVVMMTVGNYDLGFGAKAADWDDYPDDIYYNSNSSSSSRGSYSGSSSSHSYARPAARPIISTTGGYANGTIRLANVGGTQATYAGSAQTSNAGGSTTSNSNDDEFFWLMVILGIFVFCFGSKCESKSSRRKEPQRCSYFKKMDRYYKTGVYSDYE